MKKYPDNYLAGIQQNTPEWLHERCGSVTASRVGEVIKRIGKKKEEYSAERHKYKMEKMSEILTGRAAEKFVTMSMAFGIENEGLAREVYAMSKEVEVERIGYIRHPSIPRSGYSPDGLVGDDGLIEIKVPDTTTHLEYLMEGIPPDEYLAQMMWGMACSGRQFCDFISFDPRLPQEYSLFVVRCFRKDDLIEQMEVEVEKFISELNAMAERLLKHASANLVAMPSNPDLTRAEIPSW